MTEELVIIGNGMAAARLISSLVAHDPERYEITVIGDEPGHAYNRVLLSSLLSGSAAPSDLPLQPAGWWKAAANVKVISGVAATAVDIDRQSVELSDRRRVGYAKLVFATGSRALRLPLPGSHLAQVHVFRTLADVENMAALAASGAKVAVIGGGLLGIEAAYGLAKRGAAVTLVHIMDRLMERQLDADAAAMVKVALTRLGIDVRLGAKTESICGGERVEGVRLAGGDTIAADAIVMAAGIAPNSEIAKQAGLDVKRGIVTGSDLQTSRSGVYAIGECAEIDGECCGLVEPAYAQAGALARRLCGDDAAVFERSSPATNLKVSGLPVFSAGAFMGGDGASAILLRDEKRGLYKKFVTRGGLLEGAVLVGDTSDAAFYLRLIRERTPIAPFRSWLAFGEAYCTVQDRQAA